MPQEDIVQTVLGLTAKGLLIGLINFLSQWTTWALILAYLAFKYGPGLLEARRLRRAGIPEIDRMTGLEFEKYLELLFRRLGYHVERTKYVGDQGADLILTKGGERTLIQAKRQRQRVGNKAVQEAAAARPHYMCHRAIVVSNQEFTQSARELAHSNQVELWGRQRLIELLLSIQAEANPSPSGAQAERGQKVVPTPIAAGRQTAPVPPATMTSTTERYSTPACPRCGKTLVLRDGRRGRFWGCSGYPSCRYTRDLTAE